MTGSSKDAELEALLRESFDEVADNGFTSRVMHAIDAPKTSVWARLAPVALAVACAALAHLLLPAAQNLIRDVPNLGVGTLELAIASAAFAYAWFAGDVVHNSLSRAARK